MSKSKIDLKEIRELMKLAEQNKLDKFVVKQGDFELHLERHAPPPVPPRALPAQVQTDPPEVSLKGERGGSHKPSPDPAPEGRYVTSPMVGTFYASAAPDKPPFVKVGDAVESGTVICIIEAMKVMNEVKAGQAGTVAEVLLQSGHPVEFGSRLIRIV